MSMDDDDEYDLDDEVLDEAFDDEDELDDFDEDDEGGMSFDDDEVLFTDDELEQHAAEDEAAAAAVGAQKKKIHIDIGFDKIAIIGALLVGIIVVIFQVTTKTAEQRVEIFRSVLTMKGASDGEVFGEAQSENIATVAPEKQQETQAFLYEPEALNNLPNNLKDGRHIEDVVIAPVDSSQVQEQKPEQGEFLPADRRAPEAVGTRGEFVSSTGRVVEQDVPEPEPEQPKPRAPKPEPEIVADPAPVVQPAPTPAVPQPVEQKVAVEEPITPQQQTSMIDQARKKLNFVPIDQVTVKQEPAVPVVADKKITPTVPEQEVIPQSVQVQQPDPAVIAQQERSKQELQALQMEIEKLRQEKLELEQRTTAIQIEAQKAELEKAAAEKAVAEAARAEAEAKAEAALAAKVIEVKKPEPEVKKEEPKAKEPEPVKVVKKAPLKKKTSSSSSRPQTLTNWQLRAAQPGKAWISMVGQRDMLAVTVGDNVRDLGKVVAITNRDGKWFVVGTTGQIVQ